MKRFVNLSAAVAMVLGSFVSVGCNKPVEQTGEAATPATETASSQTDTAKKTDEAVSIAATATAAVKLPAPPPLRFENPGYAPSSRHVFQRGFWRYDMPARGYVWVPGHWEERGVAAPFAPPPPRFEDPGFAPSGAYVFVPGYWRFNGREYVWNPGHYTLRSEVGFYYRVDYRNVNGRYERDFNRWDEQRMREHERAEQARLERERQARIEAERRAAHEREERIEAERRAEQERQARLAAEQKAAEEQAKAEAAKQAAMKPVGKKDFGGKDHVAAAQAAQSTPKKKGFANPFGVKGRGRS